MFTYEELEVLSLAELPEEHRVDANKAHWYTAQAKIITALHEASGAPIQGEVIYAVEQVEDKTDDIVQIPQPDRHWWCDDGDGWDTKEEAEEHCEEKGVKLLGYGTPQEVWPEEYEQSEERDDTAGVDRQRSEEREHGGSDIPPA